MSAMIPDRKCITWHDSEPTGAIGWLVFDSLASNVASGGLFMHSNATMKEAADLAAMMTYKNSLQQPITGGAKGGIRFDHTHPEAKNVLRRFLIANKYYIKNFWNTGSDLNTDNTFIQSVIQKDLMLSSSFVSMATIFEKNFQYPNQSDKFLSKIETGIDSHFTLCTAATGYSVAMCIQKLVPRLPNIIIQGFGTVGASLAYYIEKYRIGNIVGVIERDFFIYGKSSVSIFDMIRKHKNNISTLEKETKLIGLNFLHRKDTQNNEDFLYECLSLQSADIFSPCATRYVITSRIATILIQKTFSFSKSPWVISGANAVFNSKSTLLLLYQKGINILPEWISNSGNTLLYNELLKLTVKTIHVFDQIKSRIHVFLDEAVGKSLQDKISLFKSCELLARKKISSALDDCNNSGLIKKKAC